MAQTIAKLTDAVKQYDKHKVLDHISLNIQEGELIGLIGPSGSGKTTTIKCLLGMEKLNSGTTEIFEQRMPNRQVLSHIGYMGQSDALYESLSAKENLIFFGHLAGIKGKQLISSINHNMGLVNLEEKLNKTVNTFSGGMKRRLSLAITLLSDPSLIILDEPTVGIDPKLRQQIWNQLKYLTKQGKAVIVTTHVMDEAERCDKIGLIVEGRLFAIGTPNELKQKFNVETIEEVFIKGEEVKNQ
ncbi:ABC transporter ATP-binding protein [Staphylococcus sp. EG-SA-6]|uniref:ABC transporter ATP-binding protein n=5 Tax=Bacteria TaxID=2 RepID=A0A7Z1N7V1_STAHA|nr:MULTISPECIES: ABC transporter ATP-binding protein [Staphylococcus]KDP54929.1 ABC transporter, ATP-binding protein [Staphylococcus aureus subsp. aureus CO-98]MBN4936143.1 ABC transporter ATP-binding protein [Staphylococcus sp. EG-SA-6]HDN0930318.1 ABC transporter ATP-binding protein [Staphylococcus aureus]AKC77262.1 ABC superfamily ATP binding cassette transporter, ABC protein [Staphylococcus haemolyticus]AYX83897.1 ABC transporter ATP-binding protein [Staphylococcus haemolyticus]